MTEQTTGEEVPAGKDDNYIVDWLRKRASLLVSLVVTSSVATGFFYTAKAQANDVVQSVERKVEAIDAKTDAIRKDTDENAKRTEALEKMYGRLDKKLDIVICKLSPSDCDIPK